MKFVSSFHISHFMKRQDTHTHIYMECLLIFINFFTLLSDCRNGLRYGRSKCQSNKNPTLFCVCVYENSVFVFSYWTLTQLHTKNIIDQLFLWNAGLVLSVIGKINLNQLSGTKLHTHTHQCLNFVLALLSNFYWASAKYSNKQIQCFWGFFLSKH